MYGIRGVKRIQIRPWIVGCTILGNLAIAAPAFAQIRPDNTLPNPSLVEVGCIVCAIEGGTIRDTNLFHSFSEFSIPENGAALFNNAAQIENIFSRVTGASASEINGLMRTNGSANLFLINPNGIAFGPNVQLEIGGSLVASTASAIHFSDQGFFSASNPEISLLTVNAPFGLQYGSQPGAIVNAGELQVGSGQSIVLAGGEITIDSGKLVAHGGRVELLGAAGSGIVPLDVDGGDVQLGGPAELIPGNIRVANESTIDVSAQNGGAGGFIHIQGGDVTFADGSRIDADTLDDQNGVAISVRAVRLIIRSGAQLSASVAEAGAGQGGGILIYASESMEVIGSSSGSPNNNGGGSGGGSSSGGGSGGGGGSGNGGGSGGGDSGGGSGSGGGGGKPSKVASDARGSGQSGDLIINTGRLIIRDGAKITASTSADNSQAGDIILNASEFVEVSGGGVSNDRARSSAISAQIRGNGQAGDLLINTGRLTVRDGAEIIADTFSASQGGSLIITANESVEVAGASSNGQSVSRITAETGRLRDFSDAGILQGTGNGGSVSIATDQLIVRDGASISVSGVSDKPNAGDAGDLIIAANTIRLDTQGEIAATTTSGDGGNIFLTVQDLIILRQNSQISTTAGLDQRGGDGGNITIDLEDGFVVAVPQEDSDITANAFDGQGGNVRITARGIFGIEFREAETPLSDITASSEFGPSGTVVLILPNIDPTQGAAELPTNVGTPQISQLCNVGEGTSSFVATGRGGIPLGPEAAIAPQDLWEDLHLPSSEDNARTITASSVTPEIPSIVEAQGWVVGSDGQVKLVANVSAGSASRAFQSRSTCSLSG